MRGQRDQKLKEMIHGFWTSQCLYVMTVLGIPDYLKGRSLTCATLAELSGTHPDALYRFLRALVSLGLIEKDDRGCFMLTSFAQPLLKEMYGSLQAEILHLLHPSCWLSWGQLLHSIKTGQAAFPEIFGQSAWEYRSQHPEVGAIFDGMAESMQRREKQAILEHLDVTDVQL
ncbi:methyltransferase dimerization domain-containing protein, partial [candidate division CSSED10-310 bacterium]